MAGVLVVHAVDGRVVESRVVEGGLFEVVRRLAAEALERWDPSRSDFLVMRDFRRLSPQELEGLDSRGLSGVEGVEPEPGGGVRMTVFLISYDNVFVEGEGGRVEDYIDRAVYLVAPMLGEDVRVFLESEAAAMTSPQSPPKGLREA